MSSARQIDTWPLAQIFSVLIVTLASLQLFPALAIERDVVLEGLPTELTEEAFLSQPLEAMQAQLTSNKYAIVVGIDSYFDELIPPLQYCTADAQDLAQALIEYCGYPTENVLLLTNESATKDQILAEISALADRGRYPQADTVIFYFSGHGAVIDGENYLIPYDGSLHVNELCRCNLRLDDVFQRLSASGFPRKLIFADACRSFLSTGERALTVYDPDINQALLAAEFATGLKALFASKFGHIAREDASLQHGLFSYFLIAGLQGEAKLENGIVTFDSLQKYVEARMIERFQINQSAGVDVMRMQIPVEAGEGNDGMVLAVFPRATETRWYAQRKNDEGLGLLNASDLPGAKRCFEEAIEIDPGFADTYMNLGRTQYLLGDKVQSLRNIDHAIELDPQNSMAYLLKLMLLYLEQRTDEALDLVNRMDESVTEYSEILATAGVILIAAERSADAIPILEKSLAAGKPDAFAYTWLGIAYQKQGNSDHAIALYDIAFELIDGDISAYLELGKIFDKCELYEKSAACYREVVKCDPNNFDALNLLAGLLLYFLDKPDEALPLAKRAAQVNPESAYARFQVGMYYFIVEQYALAIDYFQQAIQLESDNAKYWSNLGLAYLLAGRIDDSIEAFQQVLEINADDVEAHLWLGEALRVQGKYGEAAAEYATYLLKDQEPSATAFTGLGICLVQLGDYATAQRAFNSALEHSSPGEWAYDNALAGLQWLRDNS